MVYFRGYLRFKKWMEIYMWIFTFTTRGVSPYCRPYRWFQIFTLTPETCEKWSNLTTPKGYHSPWKGIKFPSRILFQASFLARGPGPQILLNPPTIRWSSWLDWEWSGKNIFLFPSLLGEDFQFASYFSDGLKPPTRLDDSINSNLYTFLYFHLYHIYTYSIYLEPFDDPCFDWNFDLVLQGKFYHQNRGHSRVTGIMHIYII